MRLLTSPRLAAALALGALLAGAAAAGASGPGPRATGLPHVGSGHRPGPDVLYAPPASAPQLQNTGPWHAAPILISGTSAYRNGEWLYQDYLFDDHGATGVVDPNNPDGPSSDLYSPAAGTFTYPTDPHYAGNAADLVEFRVRTVPGATAFRLTLNSLIDPALVGATVALGSSPTAVAWPHGAGVRSPAAAFVTWHGSTAELVSAATGTALSPAPTVRVDLARRQIELLVPHAAWNPGRSAVRMTVGTGLWNAASGAYLAPAPGPATATVPGGGTPTGVALVNVGPRYAEPWPTVAGLTMADTAVGATAEAAWWRERQQSLQLTEGDLTPFAGTVDFAKLAAGVTDNSGVPTSGPMDRILASHYSFGQGVDATQVCFTLATNSGSGAACRGRFVGQLQPYAVDIPHAAPPASGYGLTLLLHSLSANYNQYSTSHMQSELADRGTGSIVITPAGRGPDGFYAGVPEADTFEVWADIARHYPLDPSLSDVSGYSMGGFGTYRLLARYPDLFARGFSVVGAPGSVNAQLASLRNTPLLAWNASADELVNLSTSEAAVSALQAAGVRFTEDLFAPADHLTLAANDSFAPGAAFLGDARVVLNPAHVTYVVDPRQDAASVGVFADHAYWLSAVTPRSAGGDATVDAASAAFGQGDPAVLATATSAGVLTGGELPALPYVSRTQAWGPTPVTAARDALTVTLHNVATVTVDPVRAGLSCAAAVQVTSDGPASVTLAGCGRTLQVG